ncbi:TPA: helix-turn-helix transcriptional regulator [Clostridium perfringens]|uniref:helix-turn-helix transcriptional regulator n=1 Tax=Clostridium perfringens TaxID=1502 RepID=UPI001CB4FE6E|nr:helix-turn-helix transcriptional regulator [Clostridium perfringens]MDM0592829.1 helix-turn-helix transcriptional regulator [Clostridium perfringens]MDM0595828.1 helix-turn-helix transcriptional regulator [Clostridium perfringens]HBI6883121.1 helix-turn-helix transcriptional regulator [Clostridium perfringens]HBI6900079.1 helix-turn-helix transcriptional regulator [Clostridium perfringens]
MLKDKIKKSRKEMNLTQQEFAKLLGISRGNLGDLENGKNKGGNLSLIRKLSEVTGKEISYFLDSDSEFAVKQYEVLDNAINMLITKGAISKSGKVSPKYKKILFEILEQEIALKLERRENGED